MMDRDVDYGLMAVVRVLEALKVSQPMVGGPLDIARITPDGARRLEEKDIEEVRRHVERWEQADRYTLDSLFDGDP
jgi:proteasome beta subunit